MSKQTEIPEDDHDDFFDDDDFCDCEEYDADLLVGLAQCYRCGRSWWMTEEQITTEIRWQTEMMECVEESEDEQ